jgi:chorismate mutase
VSGDEDAQRELDSLRRRISAVDRALVEHVAERLRIAKRIGELKARLALPVMDPAREAEVVRRAAAVAREQGADPELIRAVLWQIIDHARTVQDD